MSEKKIILVTGGNGGIGRAIAKSFLTTSPIDIVYVGVHQGRQFAQEIAELFPDRCRIISLDVTDASQWTLAVEKILGLDSRIDVLVNNAGTIDDGLLASMSESSWRSVMASNLDATYLGCHAVLPAMIAQRFGRIINMASLSALLAPAGQANYAAAKAGIIALTRSLSKEMARMNITVNAICPGFIETEALSSFSPEQRREALAKVPMRRFGKPEEVASLVQFLACREASYITGSSIKIDGGIY